MSRAIDIRDSIENTKEIKKLPTLQKRCGTSLPKQSRTMDVYQMKMQIAAMELQIRQYKSKTVRLNQKINDSKTAVKRTLDKNNESNQVVIASNSTLAQIQENVNSLENALDKANSEFNALRTKDSFYVSNELQEELKVYYLESQRLHKQKESIEKSIKIINNEFEVIKQQIENFQVDQKQISSLQDNINEAVGKINAYAKSDIKFSTIEIQKQLQDNPNSEKDIEQKLKEKVDKLQQDVDNENKRLENIAKNDERNMLELQQIIEDQVAQINEVLEILAKQEIENEEIEELPKQEEEKPLEKEEEPIETF